MSDEMAFLQLLRVLALHPAARGLNDDTAVLEIAGTKLVLTHDSIVEGVHFLASDPPESVAWKLVAVNLSDLAAKGAVPRGALMAYTLTGDTAWDAAFVRGLGLALDAFDLPLLGGDTVHSPHRILGLTVIGEAQGAVPSRSGAHAGDGLFVTGNIGDAGLGLHIAIGQCSGPDSLLNAYRYPVPQLEAGQRLSPIVSAMMDISDGLLIDAQRLAKASGLCAMIDLDTVPLSQAALSLSGENRAARIAAATAGDDYQLLFTASLPLPPLPVSVTRIGRMARGSGLNLQDRDGTVPLPERLGWLHGLP